MTANRPVARTKYLVRQRQKNCQGAEGVGFGEGLAGNRLSQQIMAKPTEHVKIKPQNIIMLRNAGLQRSLLQLHSSIRF